MFSSFAKIAAAAACVAAPFIAGRLGAGLPETPAAVILAVIGIGLGLSGLAVFCSLDTAEVVAHLRRLNPGLRTGRRES